MTKWRGWVSIHRGGQMKDQLACSQAFEFSTQQDSVADAQRELEQRWIDGGRKVSAQWSEEDKAEYYPNVERVRD